MAWCMCNSAGCATSVYRPAAGRPARDAHGNRYAVPQCSALSEHPSTHSSRVGCRRIDAYCCVEAICFCDMSSLTTRRRSPFTCRRLVRELCSTQVGHDRPVAIKKLGLGYVTKTRPLCPRSTNNGVCK